MSTSRFRWLAAIWALALFARLALPRPAALARDIDGPATDSESGPASAALPNDPELGAVVVEDGLAAPGVLQSV